ncbi:MAG: arsenate reductase ArsC [Chloroflexi bacterium]|nr:arsenate reductase ArsC [Chloroflexota bacterium]
MKTVLFVCVHNAVRSQMAEAFVNSLGAGRVRAISAGTEPADRINPLTAEVMREAGIDMGQHRPKQLTPEMMEQADRVITMGCGVDSTCLPVPADEDWALDDPRHMPLEGVRRTRDEIKVRVAALLQEMAL